METMSAEQNPLIGDSTNDSVGKQNDNSEPLPLQNRPSSSKKCRSTRPTAEQNPGTQTAGSTPPNRRHNPRQTAGQTHGQTPTEESVTVPVCATRKDDVPTGASGSTDHDRRSTPGAKSGHRKGHTKPGSETRGQRSQTPKSGAKGGNRQGTPNKNKQFKPFEDYLSREAVSDGLKRGQLLQGTLRINPRNFEESYISPKEGGPDIMISGVTNRNRALEGDVVAIQLYPRKSWKFLREDYEAHLNKNPQEEGTSNVPPGTKMPSNERNELPEQFEGITINNSSQEGETEHSPRSTSQNEVIERTRAEIDKIVKRLFKVADEQTKHDDVPERFLQKLAKVVYIIEKVNTRACCGVLKPQNNNATDALFSPKDHRMPRMYIALTDCPEGFRERPADYEMTLFIARLTDWPKSSLYARGTLHRSLGEAGEIEPETEGILIEHGVDYSEFSEEVIDCLPTNLPWTIPAAEIAKRRDFRDHCVFTIDPATARDLDDALSCVPLGDGLYEVGVHIADVGFFVDEGNALDLAAARRATSVYMVQKVIPMLPRLLCEHLCSLNPNEDKLAFSFLWKLSEEGEILDEWCGRSIIRSCVKMSYDHAQGIIDDPARAWRDEEMPPIMEGFTIADIVPAVLHLHKIAKSLRLKRTESGALRLDQVKLQYTLNKETGLPSGYWIYQQKYSNKLIEEFMLLANMAAAHRGNAFDKETALLRQHAPPKAKPMDALVAMCADLGLKVDATNSKTMQESINRYLGSKEDDLKAWGIGQILTVLCSKPMQRAKYFCTGTVTDEALYHHYALNVPLYTHFTSPIRRYADILVHRQLAASLGVGYATEKDALAIQEQAKRCNERKGAAKNASDMSSEMFFAIFVKECGPLEQKAMVMQVLDHSFDVLVLNLGVSKRIYCNALPLESFQFVRKGKQGELRLTWEADGVHPREETQTVRLFSLINVALKAATEPLKYNAVMLHPGTVIG